METSTPNSRSTEETEGNSNDRKVTNALLYFISTAPPLNSTHMQALKHLIETAGLQYAIPGAEEITALIEDKYSVISAHLKMKIQRAANLSFSTLIWTEVKNTRRYLGITCHFLDENKLRSVTIGVVEMEKHRTVENLCNDINKICKEWNIDQNKIISVVWGKDNNDNYIMEIQDCLKINLISFRCFARTIKSVCQKVVDDNELKELTKSVTAIVNYFNNNVNANNKLIEKQISNNKNLTPQRLIGKESEEWISIFHMLERFNDLGDVILSLQESQFVDYMASTTFILTIKEILNLLRPIVSVTKDISNQRFVTGSIIIPMLCYIQESISNCHIESQVALKLKKNLLASIKGLVEYAESVLCLKLATLFDPRFKNTYFTDSGFEPLYEIINSELNARPRDSETCNGNKLDPMFGISSDSDLWSFHSQKLPNSATSSTALNDGALCFRQYLSEPLLYRNMNPIRYWESKKVIWKDLSVLAVRYLTVVATSVPEPLFFDNTFCAFTDTANHLDKERLYRRIFFNSLQREDWNL